MRHSCVAEPQVICCEPERCVGRQGGRFPRVSSRTSATSLSSPVSMQNEALADDVTPGAEKGACQDSPSPSEITDTASPPELTHRGIQTHYAHASRTHARRPTEARA